MALELDNKNNHLYMRVYHYYKDLILSGKLKPGAKTPSLRRCAAELQMSRTSVETAYLLLAADGYIISRAQSGCILYHGYRLKSRRLLSLLPKSLNHPSAMTLLLPG